MMGMPRTMLAYWIEMTKVDRNRQILVMRSMGLTLAEVAHAHGISVERVRQLIQRAERRAGGKLYRVPKPKREPKPKPERKPYFYNEKPERNLEICRRIAAGESRRALALEYGVSYHRICVIKRRHEKRARQEKRQERARARAQRGAHP
jgi:DNA-binding CsgD family transcriptional regulator